MSQKINGVDLNGLNQILNEISKEKDKAKELSLWRVRLRWLGGFKTRAYMRRHSIDIDEPADLAGIDTAQNAVETLLASLGACIATTFILFATSKGIKIENLELAIEGQLDNVLVFLGLEKEGNPGFKSIEILAYIRTEAEQKVIEDLFIEAMKSSPVFNTLTRGAQINHKIKIF
jgi:uncharacterized OsmC-like protein